MNPRYGKMSLWLAVFVLVLSSFAFCVPGAFLPFYLLALILALPVVLFGKGSVRWWALFLVLVSLVAGVSDYEHGRRFRASMLAQRLRVQEEQRKREALAVGMPWDREELVGKTWTLNDPVFIAVWSFTQDGTVLAELGRKNDAVAAPVFRWRIEGLRLSIFEEDSGKAVEEWVLVSREGKRARVRTMRGAGSQIVEYTITP